MTLVISIIVVLLALAVKQMSPAVDFGKEVRVKSDIQSVTTALRMYNAQNGFYPSTEQGLKALVVQPTTEPRPRQWRCAFEDGKVPRDPWDKEYNYTYPGTHNPRGFDLFSAGPDRQFGTPDDIGNWDTDTSKN